MYRTYKAWEKEGKKKWGTQDRQRKPPSTHPGHPKLIGDKHLTWDQWPDEQRKGASYLITIVHFEQTIDKLKSKINPMALSRENNTRSHPSPSLLPPSSVGVGKVSRNEYCFHNCQSPAAPPWVFRGLNPTGTFGELVRSEVGKLD